MYKSTKMPLVGYMPCVTAKFKADLSVSRSFLYHFLELIEYRLKSCTVGVVGVFL